MENFKEKLNTQFQEELKLKSKIFDLENQIQENELTISTQQSNRQSYQSE